MNDDSKPETAAPKPGDTTTPANPLATPSADPAAEAKELLNPTPSAQSDSADTADNPKSDLSGTISSFFFGLLNWVIIPIAIVFVLHNFVFQAFHVVGSSMVPTLQDANYLIISKVDKSISELEHKTYIPSRYQVIVFQYPQDHSLVFVKRVIALPGERVTVKDGRVTVYNAANPNGFSPDTTAYQRAADTSLGEIDEVVPPDQIFVMGDNRTPNGSFDSREWGTLPSNLIIGRAFIRLIPLDGFRLFSDLPQVILHIAR